ncbi:MAG: HlyC/CorC family transporter [Lachnospiraceae bacterium]|nr:HlyC/CorC family transporter [Lachnospiraceae bacterium]
MEDGYLPMSFGLLIGFILLEACLYGFGAAIQNVNTGKLEQEMEAGNIKAARLLRIVNRPTRFVNAIQIITHLVGMITGAYVVSAFRFYLEKILAENQLWMQSQEQIRQMLLLAVIALILLVLMISFGVIIPKRCAARSPESWGYHLLPVIIFITRLFLPLILFINGVCRVVLALIRIDMNGEGENVTEEDIMSMVNEGHEQGVVEADEAEMITNIFQLNDKEARDIMIHRKNIAAMDSHMLLGDAVEFILKEGNNSRYPVYEEDMDDIIGLLHMKDALLFAENEENRSREIGEIPGLLRDAHFIPETRSIDTLFKEMQAEKIHMEIVVDEYGQTAGVVTMEDILEEIVGNIMDEYDEEEEFIIQNPDGSFVFEGLTPLKEVEAALGITFAEEDLNMYDTLNGFLVSRLNRIPKEGESLWVDYEGYEFRILKVKNKIIHSVRVSALPSAGGC